MDKLVKLCVCAMILMGLSLWGADEPFVKQTAGNLKFSVQFPPNWQYVEGAEQVEAFPNPADKGTTPQNIADVPIKVLITAVDLTGRQLPDAAKSLSDMTVDELFDASVAAVKKNVGDLKLIDTGKADVNGKQAIWGLMTYVEQGKSIKQLSYMIKDGNNAYVVECLIDIDKYDQNIAACKQIINSFKILVPEKPVVPPIAPPVEIKG